MNFKLHITTNELKKMWFFLHIMTVTSYIVKLIQTCISKLLVCDGKLTISLHTNKIRFFSLYFPCTSSYFLQSPFFYNNLFSSVLFCSILWWNSFTREYNSKSFYLHPPTFFNIRVIEHFCLHWYFDMEIDKCIIFVRVHFVKIYRWCHFFKVPRSPLLQ